MPTIFRNNGIRFFFWSNEGNEPMHIHFEKGDAHGKCWIEPDLEINYFFGFTNSETKAIEKEIEQNIELIKTRWNEYFN